MTELQGGASLPAKAWFPPRSDVGDTSRTCSPFPDKRVRIACDVIIDKEALIQGSHRGQGPTSPSAGYPTSAAHSRALVQRPQDIEAAKALLAEAGAPEGSLNIVFKATTNCPCHIETAQIPVEWFRMAGINLTIGQLTRADGRNRCRMDKDHQTTMLNFLTLWEPDFLSCPERNSTGAFNYRAINDPILVSIALSQAVPLGDRAAVHREKRRTLSVRVREWSASPSPSSPRRGCPFRASATSRQRQGGG